MSMTIPTIPSLPAGYTATLADMQNLAACATFALNKPISFILDETGGQAIGTSVFNVVFTNAIVDPDAMWGNVGNPSRVIVQTPGWYKVRYGANCSSAGGVYNTWINSTSGSNNPVGAGVTTGQLWAGYSTVTTTSQSGWSGGSGIMPVYLYQGDYLTLRLKAAATGTSTGITAPGTATLAGSWISTELVSI